MSEYIRRLPIRVALVDDNASYLGRIEAWCSSHQIGFERARNVFESIGDFETFLAAGRPMPHIIVLDDDFSNATNEQEKRRKGLDYLKVLKRIRRYNTVVVFGSSEIDPRRTEDAKKAGADLVVPKREWGEQVDEYLEEAYQEVLRRSAQTLQLDETIASVETQLRQGAKPDEARPLLFLITPFPAKEDQKLKDILSMIENAAAAEGYFATTAEALPDRPTVIKDLIRSYMHICSRAIAVFYRRPGETAFNANVALEVGYMLALDKPVLLLNFLTEIEVPADLHGVVYQQLAGDDYMTSLSNAVRKWLAD